MEAAKGERLYIPVILAAYYGLRRSEAVGLMWSDIDFENKRIYIRNKASEVKKDGRLQTVITDEMKTESSKRALPLLPEVEKILLEHREMQEEYRRLYRRDYSKQYLDMVCVDPLGNLIRPNYISERFPKMLKKNGLPRIRFHDLRHSCASMLIAHKAGMKQVQMWMGHSSITTTVDIKNRHMIDKPSKQPELVCPIPFYDDETLYVSGKEWGSKRYLHEVFD